jgi:phosphatidylethanolamine-binding protein
MANLPTTLKDAALLSPKLGLQPNIIPPTFTPTLTLKAIFTPSNPTSSTATTGSLLRKSQLAGLPDLVILPLGADRHPDVPLGTIPRRDPQDYTIMFLDPDAPTPDDPKFGYWRHWIVRGCWRQPGTGGRLNLGETVSPWIAPGVADSYVSPFAFWNFSSFPFDVYVWVSNVWKRLTGASRSGPHRYLLLLFQEPEEGYGPTKEDVGGDEFVDRRSFDAVCFVQKFGLKLVAVTWVWGVGDGWVA